MSNKKMKTFEDKTLAELTKLLAEKREALREVRFSAKGSRTRNVKSGVAIRKDIARIMTREHTLRHAETTTIV